MAFTRWLRNLKSSCSLGTIAASSRLAARSRAAARCQPRLEALEDRTVPATILVNTFADVVGPGDGLLSLREAIALAADPATHAGDDTIVLPHEIGGVAGTYALGLGKLAIDDATGELTIESDGGPATIDARGASGVFEVTSGSEVVFQGLTITGGSAQVGGGILNQGTLMITGSTLSGNTADAGGGVYNLVGTLTITGSTLSGNTAGSGGGVLNNRGTLTITGSTLSGNSANSGAGVLNFFGTLTISDSIIRDNNGEGVRIEGSRGSQLLGNTITGNSNSGVLIFSDKDLQSMNQLIGSPLAGNTIAFNGGAGVAVVGPGTGIAIRGNAIYGNAGPGIDLGDDGLTANDFQDPDAGPNNLQNVPVLGSASSNGASTTVAGALNSTPNRTFLVDVYASPPDGLGQTYLGAVAVLTDGNGNALFSATFARAVAAGWAVTATATTTDSAPYGDTSEFALGVPVLGPGGGTSANRPPVNSVPLASQAVARNKTLTFARATGNAISVSDPDAGTTLLQVSLTVEHGTLTLAGSAGLTFLAGDGQGDATITLQGTVEAVNAALNGLTYRPANGYVGSDTLRITTNDLGSGLGDPLIVSDLVAILVGQPKK